ncbi:MAG: hypothetical protein WC807_00500 [Hyphomicrobium sp.]
MSTDLRGIGRLTHVVHPLERLGELCRNAELARKRRRSGHRREALLNSASGGLVVIAALVSFGPFTRALVVPEALRELPPAVTLTAAPPTREGAVELRSFETRTAIETQMTTARAMALASAGDTLPKTVAPLRASEVAPEHVREAAAVEDEVSAAGTEVALIAPVQAVLLTGLPAGTTASKGAPVADGEWAFALADLTDIKVTLPDGSTEPVRAKVEIAALEGGEPASIAFVIKPNRKTAAVTAGKAKRQAGGHEIGDDNEAGNRQRARRRKVKAEIGGTDANSGAEQTNNDGAKPSRRRPKRGSAPVPPQDNAAIGNIWQLFGGQ